MFPLHESTQRLICRAAFAALCIVPTTSLLAYALWLHTPLYRQAQAVDLSHRTGTSVSLAELHYPQPGTARLTNVVLTHSQTGEEIARVRELELQRSGDKLLILAAQPQLSAEHLDELWRQITRHLLHESFPSCEAIHLIAHDATLISGGGEAQTFAVLEAEFKTHDQQRTFRLTYQLAGTDADSPAVFRMVHQLGDATKIYWNTGGASLSLAPWASQWPALKSLGADCQFRGIVSVSQAEQGSSGQVTGELTNVDLDRLVSHNLPHKLSGNATVNIDSAQFENDRFVAVKAHVVAGPGVVETALLDSAAEQWSLAVDGASDAPAKKLQRYKMLACDVSLADGQLSIEGACRESPPQTLLVLEDDRAWRTILDAAHSPASLIRVLSHSADANVPATESTRHLIRWLPLAPGESATTPRAHLRGS